MMRRCCSRFNARKLALFIVLAGAACGLIFWRIFTAQGAITVVPSVPFINGTNFVVKYGITNKSNTPLNFVIAPEGRSNSTWVSSRIYIEGYPFVETLQPGQGVTYTFELPLSKTNYWSATRLLVRYDRVRGQAEKVLLRLKEKLTMSQSGIVSNSFNDEEIFVVSETTEIPKVRSE